MRAWIQERPPAVRAVAEHFDPWSLYRMKSTGHRVIIQSFSEHDDGRVTLTVLVSGQFNAIAFERSVFGIDPADLQPCELPEPSEAHGAVLTQDQVEENLDEIRLRVRPDLWVRDEATGKAVRKH